MTGEGKPRPSLLIVNQFALLPSDGGGTRHFELGRELVRRGWRVTILASDFHMHRRVYSRRANQRDRAAKVELVEGVEVRWLWAAPYKRNDWRRGWNWLSFARSVRRTAASLPRPDVVIGSSPQLLAARAAYQAAKSLNTRFAFEVRDLWPESLVAAGGRRGIAYHVLDRVAANLYRVADRIVVLARGTADYLVARGIPARKIVFVPNGVDVDSMRPAALGVGARENHWPFILVYAGAHGPANGLDRLLDAAEILGPRAPVRFVLIGDGPSKDSLRADAARRALANVEFRDSVSKPALVTVLSEADAGLMLLRDATLFSFGVSPNKLFDYFAVGLPVVCNVPGDVSRMLRESGAGVQAKDTGGRALANAIDAMRAKSPDERRAMGSSGRQWVEREHSREVLGARLDAHLRDLLRA
jgi:glycosyltransferase involved in cell wall biosynthesis